MQQSPSDLSSISNSELTEEEALQLANELTSKLMEGETPSSDQVSIQRMVAGLGDTRGKLRLTFAKSLEPLEQRQFQFYAQPYDNMKMLLLEEPQQKR